MIKTSISELFSLVHSLVQADNGGHVVETEVGKVVVRRVKRVAILNATLVVWTSKGQELAYGERERERERCLLLLYYTSQHIATIPQMPISILSGARRQTHTHTQLPVSDH